VPGYSVKPDLAPRAHAEAKRARAGVRARVVEARNEHNLAGVIKWGDRGQAPATPRLRFPERQLLANPDAPYARKRTLRAV